MTALRDFMSLSLVPCHRRADRSFHCCQRQFPVCARCTGILIGYITIPALLFFGDLIPLWWGLVFNIPMLIDGFTQKWGWRESNNWLRLATGLLSGFGQSILVVGISLLIVEMIAH